LLGGENGETRALEIAMKAVAGAFFIYKKGGVL